MVGEALIGSGPEIAHIDLVIGPRGGPVETAFMNFPGNAQTGAYAASCSP